MTSYLEHAQRSGFETKKDVVRFRKDVSGAIRNCLPDSSKRRRLLLGPCKNGARCERGLCPKCVRKFRMNLIRFADGNQLHKLNWHFVTFTFDSWRMPPGDYQSFSNFLCQGNTRLIDINDLKALKTRLKRAHKKLKQQDAKVPPLRVIGSIETQYEAVDNLPTGKPFHLHLLISGLNRKTIETCTRTFLDKRNQNLQGRKIDIRAVSQRPQDFVKVLTYCSKQPFVKKSSINQNTIRLKIVWAKRNELAEIAANLDQVEMNERLILIGFRHGFGKLIML